MIKCTNCGVETDDSAAFCENCGTKILHEKECPVCHEKVKLAAKFCAGCGYNFNSGKKNSSGGGFSVGDKNVIAGDVIGKQETIQVTGSATIIRNEDESRKMVQCHVCGKNILITESSDCPQCGQTTCHECFNGFAKMCAACVEQRDQDYAERYLKLLQESLADGKITLSEREQLDKLRAELNLSKEKCEELETQAREQIGKEEDAGLSNYAAGTIEKSYELLYGEGEAAAALELMQPLYSKYPDNEEILSAFLAAAIQAAPEKAEEVLGKVRADFLGCHLAGIDRSLQNGQFEDAEQRIRTAMHLWSGNLMLYSRKIICLVEMYRKIQSQALLDEAAELVNHLPAPRTWAEVSWHFKSQYVVSCAQGNNNEGVTLEYCRQNHLYPCLILGRQDTPETLETARKAAEATEKAKAAEAVYSEAESNICWDDELCEFVIDKYGRLEQIKNMSRNIRIPEGVKELCPKPLDSFSQSPFKSLEAIRIPGTVKNIGAYTFYDCRNLLSVLLAEGVTSIGERAFQHCSLKEILIPGTVKTIGDLAFYECSSLSSVKLQEGVTSIGERAFQDCSLKEILIPGTVKTIGDNAFYDCKNLSSVKLQEGVTSIRKYAFSGCSSLTEFHAPKTIKKIGSYAFYDCYNLSSAVLIGTIGEHAFAGCRLLASVKLLEGASSIGEDAFWSCVQLSSVILSEGVTSIGDNAFASCEVLTEIQIPGTVKTIGSGAFRDCSRLLSVQLNEGIETIGSAAFMRTSLTTIRLPASIRGVGKNAFDCETLQSIYVPKGFDKTLLKDALPERGFFHKVRIIEYKV